jgi:glycine cleavage system H protein
MRNCRRPFDIKMNGGDYFEFSIAHDRKYTLDHLWLQVLDEKNDEMSVKIGISEFIRAEYGDIVRVVLTKPEDDSEFQMGNGGDEDENDDTSTSAPITSGDELDVDDLLITIRTTQDRVLINTPFSCKIAELNGDVEENPDLVNEEAYGDGWCMIVKPHDWDEDMYLNENEYIEYLNEI